MRIITAKLTDFQGFADSGLIPFEPITVFVGRNNSGKSTILNAISSYQTGLGMQSTDLVRIGSTQARVSLDVTGISVGNPATQGDGRLDLTIPGGGMPSLEVRSPDAAQPSSAPLFPSDLPAAHLILLRADNDLRRFDEQVNEQTARTIRSDLSNLVGLISALRGSARDTFQSRFKELFGFTLDLIPSQNGQLPGQAVGAHDAILARAMGAGVIRVARMLVLLASSRDKIVLLEEPENDLHPVALKAMLSFLHAAATDNQIVITTHSHIVVNGLAALPGCALYRVDADSTGLVPTAMLARIDTPAGRVQLLRHLGNELTDFGLYDGYLILEESSAEVIVQRLISWFTPRLVGRLRTIACDGADDTDPRFRDLHRLFVYLHLEQMYRSRAWVVLDGDEKGKDVVRKLQMDFAGWPADHFQSLPEADFELFYPRPFIERAKTVLAERSRQVRRRLKRELMDEVLMWIDQDGTGARAAFKLSAGPVIDVLRAIEEAMLGQPGASEAGSIIGGGGAYSWQWSFVGEDETGPVVALEEARHVVYSVEPGKAINSWRFGVKFGSRPELPHGRVDAGWPLWHLAKNGGQGPLVVVYYDVQGRAQNEVPVGSGYHGEKVHVELEVIEPGQLRIRVLADRNFEQVLALPDHSYAQPRAWADGKPLFLRVVCSSTSGV